MDYFNLYRKKKKNKNKEKTTEKMSKGLEQEKVTKEYHVPSTKAELAFMKQQEKLVEYFSLLIYCLIKKQIVLTCCLIDFSKKKKF